MTVYVGLKKQVPTWDTPQQLSMKQGQYLNKTLLAHSEVQFDITDYILTGGELPTGLAFDRSTQNLYGFAFADPQPVWETPSGELALTYDGDSLSLTVTARKNSGIGLYAETDATDPNFSKVSLLMHFDEQYGKVYLDTRGNTYTLKGNATLADSPSKWGSAVQFNGSTAYVEVAYNSNVVLTTGDFTIEYWEYRTDAKDTACAIDRPYTNGYSQYLLGYSSSGKLYAYMTSTFTSWDVANAKLMGDIVINQWIHYAVTRQGNTFRTFQNGTLISTWTSTASLAETGGALNIGYRSSSFFKGAIDDVRITKGLARYTENFTIPTSRFPDKAKNSKTAIYLPFALTGDNGQILDKTGKTLTLNGDVTLSPDRSVSGDGSGLFDGNGWLSVPYSEDFNISGEDFTLEFTAFPTDDKTATTFSQTFSIGNMSPLTVTMENGRWRLYSSSGTTWDVIPGLDMGAVEPNNWQELAVTRSGNNWYTFKNGSLTNTIARPNTISPALSDGTNSSLTPFGFGSPTWVSQSTIGTYPNNVNFSVNVSATGAMSYHLKDCVLPSGLSFNNGTLSGKVPSSADPVTHQFTVRAINAYGGYSDRTFSITFTNSAPVWSGTNTATYLIGPEYTFNLVASDANSDPFTFSQVGGSLPDGMSLVGSTIKGYPGTLGTFTATIRATDIHGAYADRNITITIARNYTSGRQIQQLGGQSGFYSIRPDGSATDCYLYCDQSIWGGGYTRVARFVCNSIGSAVGTTTIDDNTNGYLPNSMWALFRDQAQYKDCIFQYIVGGVSYWAKCSFNLGVWQKTYDSLMPTLGPSSWYYWNYSDPGRNGVDMDYSFISYSNERGISVYNYGEGQRYYWNGSNWNPGLYNVGGGSGVMQIWVR
jgi:hypothetical protein